MPKSPLWPSVPTIGMSPFTPTHPAGIDHSDGKRPILDASNGYKLVPAERLKNMLEFDRVVVGWSDTAHAIDMKVVLAHADKNKLAVAHSVSEQALYELKNAKDAHYHFIMQVAEMLAAKLVKAMPKAWF